MSVRCWAFNVTGSRCELPGGHEGTHQVAFEWTDDESFTPLSVPFLPSEPAGQLLTEDEEELPPPTVCYVCNHVWHDAKCEMPAEGGVCGCMTAVA